MPQQLDSINFNSSSGINGARVALPASRRRLLMAVAVQQRARRHACQIQVKAAGVEFARDEFLNKKSALPATRCPRREHGRNSSRMPNRHDGSSPTMGTPRSRYGNSDHEALRLLARLVHHAAGEVGAAATQRARVTFGLRQMARCSRRLAGP